MNVSLAPELEKFITEEIKSGKYSSAEEVIREGLRLLREYEQEQHKANGGASVLPVEQEDILNWDVSIDVASSRPSGTIEATLVRAREDKPIPVEDPWSE